MTLDLLIDSSAYNEASEQRPEDRGFLGKGICGVGGGEETQGDE